MKYSAYIVFIFSFMAVSAFVSASAATTSLKSADSSDSGLSATDLVALKRSEFKVLDKDNKGYILRDQFVKGKSEKFLKTYDKNSDASVSKDEYDKENSSLNKSKKDPHMEFASMDKSHSGLISKSDMSDARARFYEQMDRNTDGKVSKEECEKTFNDIFDKADSDGDGRITENEYVNYYLPAAKKAVKASENKKP